MICIDLIFDIKPQVLVRLTLLKKTNEIERTFFSQGEHLRLKVQQSSSECLEPESLNHIHNIDTTVIKIIII